MRGGDVWGMLKDAGSAFIDDKTPRLGAALAYYTVFSMSPLLVLVVVLLGHVTTYQSGVNSVQHALSDVMGSQAGNAIGAILKAGADREKSGRFATIVSLVILVIGASTVFAELQDSLNTIWQVAPKPAAGARGVWVVVRNRLFSFALVLGVCFLLLVSLILSAIMQITGHYMSARVGGAAHVWVVLNFAGSFAVVTTVFALLYKVVPDVELAWKDVWIGAIITAILFTTGKFALGLYLAKASITSAYGAAGSLAALLVWTYYAAQIFFFGAEFTRVYAMKYGSKFTPDRRYVREPPLGTVGGRSAGNAPSQQAADKPSRALSPGATGRVRDNRGRSTGNSKGRSKGHAGGVGRAGLAIAIFATGLFLGTRRGLKRAAARVHRMKRPAPIWGRKSTS